jgi:putative iron-only hydrogenase system regulator
MTTRLGYVGILIEDRANAAPLVNAVLSEYARIIVARTGLPYEKRGVSIITLIVDATTDDVGALTGRLGRIPGVSVKSALSKAPA